MNSSLTESNATTSLLSHELRTPLNAIIGFSDLIVEEDSLDDIKIFADIIRESGLELLDKLIRIIDAEFLFGDNELKISKIPPDVLFSNIQIKTLSDGISKYGLIKYTISKEALSLQLLSDIERIEKIIFTMIKGLLKSYPNTYVFTNLYLINIDSYNQSFVFAISTNMPLSLDYCRMIIKDKICLKTPNYYSYKDGLGIDIAICEYLAAQLNVPLFVECTSVNANFVLSVPHKTNYDNE